METTSPVTGTPKDEGLLTSKKVANASTDSQQEVSRAVSVDLLEFGDIVRIAQGSSPPCDGTVCTSLFHLRVR